MTSLYMFDHLMNGMVNPIFMLATGAVAGAHFNRLPKARPANSGPIMMGRPQRRYVPQQVNPQSFRPA